MSSGPLTSVSGLVPRLRVSNILGKLGLASRTQAALYAVEHKLVAPPRARAGGPCAGNVARLAWVS